MTLVLPQRRNRKSTIGQENTPVQNSFQKHYSKVTLSSHLDFNENEIDTAIESSLSQQKLHESDCDFVKVLVYGTRENLESIDKLITEKSKDWKIERMSGIDRNIVRLAIFEMMFNSKKLVPNIAINEAVELAKKFGTDDSARFVNGILGSMIK